MPFDSKGPTHVKRRLTRSLAALLAGLAVTLLTMEPATAGFVAGPDVPFTGELLSLNLHYCGVGQSQLGDTSDPAEGVAFTRPVLFFGICALAFPTTLPADHMRVDVKMVRNGSICGQTATQNNPSRSGLIGISGSPCSNPAGWQEWRTIGGHQVRDGDDNWIPGASISPWQLY